jgi:hypothetical protein
MKASPGARSWIAAGVRHELLTRALPALRHDMAAPVSVMRMALLMLKRQIGAPAIDAAACEERVSLIDHQMSELVEGIRSLRDWELATADEGITRGALVAQCVGLMRAAFDMHGIVLDVDPAVSPGTDETRWPQGAALRYLFLGALGYLHDGETETGAIRIEARGDDALCLLGTPRASSGTSPVLDAHRAPRALAIDAIALQSLADDLGYTVALERDSVCFSLGAR